MSFPLCHVTIPGEPVPKGRPRVGPTAVKTPKRTTVAQNAIGWAVKAACVGLGLPSDRLFWVSLVFRTTWAAATMRGPDGDNCEKLVLDALNGVVWRDDAQVVGVAWEIERGAARAETIIAIYEHEGEHGASLPTPCRSCGALLDRRFYAPDSDRCDGCAEETSHAW